MSERRIRELAQQSVYESGLSGYIEEAIADDPDLVELLRKIYEFQIRYSLDVPTTDALKLVRRHIEKTVRLTDDGYEWTEEATDE